MKTHSFKPAIQANQRNLDTITARLQNLAARKTQELAGEPTTVRETLESLVGNHELELDDFATTNTTNHDAAAHLVHKYKLFNFLETEQRSPEVVAIAWFTLEMEELRLWQAMKLASSVQNRLKTTMVSALVDAVNLETAIDAAIAAN